MSHNYRCKNRRDCGLRVTLGRRLEEYVREPKCKSCGGELGEVTEKERARTQRRLCRCDGAWFPHRKGGVPLCIHADHEPDDAGLDAVRSMMENYR